MTPKGFNRGHAVVFEDKCWRWADTKEPNVAEGGEDRTCVLCGLSASEPGGPDPCLGWLPDCENACCGHGVEMGNIERVSSDVTLFVVAVKTEYLEPSSEDRPAHRNWLKMSLEAEQIFRTPAIERFKARWE